MQECSEDQATRIVTEPVDQSAGAERLGGHRRQAGCGWRRRVPGRDWGLLVPDQELSLDPAVTACAAALPHTLPP